MTSLITKNKIPRIKSQQGVTLLLALLVLSSVTAISFSLAAILFVEVRTSADLTRTEPAIYAANGVAEQALFKIKRGVSTNGGPCDSYYTAKIGLVTLNAPCPVETSTAPSVQQDSVPASANTFNTAKHYPVFSSVDNPASGYGKIVINYPSQLATQPLYVYMCQFDINNPDPADVAPACSDSGANTYWKTYRNTPLVQGGTLTFDNSNGMDPNKQQEIVLVNGGGTDIYVQLQTFDSGGNPKGLSYFGQTEVDIVGTNGSVTRKIRTIIPNEVNVGGAANGFAHFRSITVNTGQVPSTQTNFPVLVSITNDALLKSAANGGNVQSNSGTDIVFTSDAAGYTTLPYELESYSPTTGTLKYWVKLPTVSDGTVFYMFYGKSGAADQSNKTAVWDANYKGVWHFPNGTTLSASDSTGLDNGTIFGGTATTGKVDGGVLTPSISLTPFTFTGDFTTSLWVKGSGDGQFYFETNNGTPLVYLTVGNVGAGGTANKAVFTLRTDSNSLVTVSSTATVNDGNWHLVEGVRSGTTAYVYVDGVQSGSGVASSGVITATGNSNIGVGSFTGTLDEGRVSNIARSVGWIGTEYNNQSNPGAFETVSGEKTPAGPGNSASFVKIDTTTQGNWHGVYGADGYNIFGATQSYPAYVSVTPSGNSLYSWANPTADTRGLYKDNVTSNRIAYTWYSGTNYTLDLNITDGGSHQVAVYMVDWDSYGPRAAKVEVLDGTNSSVLDTQNLAGYVGGDYLVWNVSGHVILRFTDTGGSNVATSGIFFK